MLSGLQKKASWRGLWRGLPDEPADPADTSAPLAKGSDDEGAQPQKASLYALLQGLVAEGLPETATCLREEAGLEDVRCDDGRSSEDVLRSLLEPGVLPPGAAAALRQHLGKQISASMTLADAHGHMQQQRENLDRIHQKLRTMREAGNQWIPSEETASGLQDAPTKQL